MATERQVANVEDEFAVNPAALEQFVRSVNVTDKRSFLTGQGSTARYVVVAVDPAGGGEASEEAFVVFFVSGARFALLTARAIHGHHPAYPFSTVPLVFVIALLETVRSVKLLLQAAIPGFTMPPVLVVMETNFAYGAAVYLQLLWFMQKQQAMSADLRDVDIVFATPVYMWDDTVVKLRDELVAQKRIVKSLEEQIPRLKAAVNEAWLNKGPRQRYLRREQIKAKVWERLRMEDNDALDLLPQDLYEVRKRVETVMDELRKETEAEAAAANYGGTFQWKRLEEFEKALTDHLTARRDLTVAKIELKRMDSEVNAAERGISRGEDNFRSRPWPSEHNPVSPLAMSFPPGYWWNAKKTALGETTTRQEKVRAFRHWVALVRRANGPKPGRPNMEVLQLPTTTADPANVFSPAPVPACKQVVLGPGGADKLPSAATVLRCMHDQWRRLQVWVHSGTGEVLRLAGKARNAEPDEEAAPIPIARDDLWMAFSIGLQWCSRFVHHIPDDKQRERLVRYMRDLRSKVHESLSAALKRADVAPDAEPVARPVAPPDVRPLEALVVVAGATNAVLKTVDDLRTLLRMYILGYVAAGYQPLLSEYKVRVRQVARSVQPKLSANEWKRQVLHEILQDGGTENVQLNRVVLMFGRTCSTLRTQCVGPPGPRYAWPGNRPKRLREGQRPALSTLIDDLRNRLDALTWAIAPQCAAHADKHPVLSNPATRSLFDLTLERLRGIAAQFDAQVASDAEAAPRALYDQHLVPELNRLAWQHQQVRPVPDVVGTIPAAPFGMYVQLAEDTAFLRRLVNYGRERIIPALAALPTKRIECQAHGPGPGIVCRLSQRRIVNWQHAFRTLWPQKDPGVPAGPPSPPILCYQSSIILRPSWLTRPVVAVQAADENASSTAGPGRAGVPQG